MRCKNIVESNNNIKNLEFKDLPEDLKKLLINLQTDKLVELDYDTGIKLTNKILGNKGVYDQAILYIQNNYKNITKELILFLFSRLYDAKKPIVSFTDFYNTYEYYQFKFRNSPVEKTDTLISTAKEISSEAKNNDTSEVSVGHSELDLSALYKWLEEKKWEYCIWISKDDRDHNKNCQGQMDLEGVAFKKLVKGYGLTFSNQNGWETIIYNKDGLYFSWSINKNGICRFWINDNLSWELFFRLLHQRLKVCNLTNKELKELIECLKDQEKSKLFLLETANLIGPREIIERDFNKACLIYKKAYFDGLYLPVEVKIDKSTGPYEIEFKGAEGPTRRLQDVTVRAFETVQSLSSMEFLIDSNLQISSATNELTHSNQGVLQSLQQQIISKEDVLVEFSELDGRLFNLDIKTDIQHVELRQDFKNLLKGVKNNSDNLGEAIILLDKGIQELKKNYDDVIFENIEPVIVGLSSVNQNVIKSKTEITKEIKNGVKEIRKDIKKVSDNLKEIIESNFKALRVRLKNNLYLLIRKLDTLPGVTAKELSNELKLSQKTIYLYLKKLQDKKLIISEIKKSTKKGRPPRIFKLKKRKERK